MWQCSALAKLSQIFLSSRGSVRTRLEQACTGPPFVVSGRGRFTPCAPVVPFNLLLLFLSRMIKDRLREIAGRGD
jgi:hypothetical protein